MSELRLGYIKAQNQKFEEKAVDCRFKLTKISRISNEESF